MKIANWNVERLKHKRELGEITKILTELDADILVLTETDSQIKLDKYKSIISTKGLSPLDSAYYKETENRVTIFSKYKIINKFETFNQYTSTCIELETGQGSLIVYGTIIGIYGNRNKNFNHDLEFQLKDFNQFSSKGNFCIVGDYNISFGDNYYFTNEGRNKLNENFKKNDIEVLTRNIDKCIDHIAISSKFTNGTTIQKGEWNKSKSLSDHKGIWVSMLK